MIKIKISNSIISFSHILKNDNGRYLYASLDEKFPFEDCNSRFIGRLLTLVSIHAVERRLMCRKRQGGNAFRTLKLDERDGREGDERI